MVCPEFADSAAGFQAGDVGRQDVEILDHEFEFHLLCGTENTDRNIDGAQRLFEIRRAWAMGRGRDDDPGVLARFLFEPDRDNSRVSEAGVIVGQQLVLQQQEPVLPGLRQSLESGLQVDFTDSYHDNRRLANGPGQLLHIRLACDRVDRMAGAQIAAREDATHLADADDNDWCLVQGFHACSFTPACWLVSRASTNSRSESLLR